MSKLFLQFLLVTNLSNFLLICNTLPINDHNKSVSYVGTIEGKSFFLDHTAHRTWADAMKFCVDENMQPAAVTTAAQNSILLNSGLLHPDYGYWTAGRDALSFSQFIWTHTQIPLDGAVPFDEPPHLNYGIIWHRGHFDARNAMHGNYALCELVHGT